MKLIDTACCAAVAILMCVSSAALAGPEGTWLSDDGGAKVRIVDCGGKLCGTVVWLDEPVDHDTGKPKTDFHNPDPGKRNRPMLGLQVVRGLTPSGPNTWSGQIYNADDGRIYQAHMRIDGTKGAQVQGCVLGILCKSRKWTRVD